MGFSVDGLDDLSSFFEGLAQLPDEVSDAMLEAEADVLADAQKRKAKEMLTGPYARDVVAESITKKKVVKTESGKEIEIVFAGKRGKGKGGGSKTRAAEIAYVNEYGVSSQPARPFMREAEKEAAEPAVEAAAKIYDNWIDKL